LVPSSPWEKFPRSFVDHGWCSAPVSFYQAWPSRLDFWAEGLPFVRFCCCEDFISFDLCWLRWRPLFVFLCFFPSYRRHSVFFSCAVWVGRDSGTLLRFVGFRWTRYTRTPCVPLLTSGADSRLPLFFWPGCLGPFSGLLLGAPCYPFFAYPFYAIFDAARCVRPVFTSPFRLFFFRGPGKVCSPNAPRAFPSKPFCSFEVPAIFSASTSNI